MKNERRQALHVMIILIACMFAVEFVSMLALYSLIPQLREEKNGIIGVLLDSTLLGLLICPALYYLVFRPMLRLATLRHRAEDERDSFFDLSLHLLCVVGFDGRIQRTNPAIERVLGFSQADSLNKSLVELVHAEDKDLTVSELQRLSHGLPTVKFENRCRAKDGSYKWLTWSFAPDLDRNLIYGIAWDTTEQRMREATLRESESKFRSIIEQSYDGIFLVDEQGKTTEWNKGMELTSGLCRAEVIGLPAWDVQLLTMPKDRRTPEMRASVKVAIEDALGSGDTPWLNRLHEVTFYQSDGKKAVIQHLTFPIKTERGYMICSINRDVTASKNSEIELRSAHHQLEIRIKERTAELLRTNEDLRREIDERQRTEEELKQQYAKLHTILERTVEAMAFMVEMKDAYTAGHQRRVADYAAAIAEEMGLSAEQIQTVRLVGLVHDIGKISVPAEILSKPSRLSEHEFGMIKAHCQVGFDILKMIEFPWPIAQIVLQHHERLDGSGYPLGLTGEAIVPEARILAVADVVEAMASHRPYRPALGLDTAMAEIIRNRDVLYDPAVADACQRLFAEKQFKFEPDLAAATVVNPKEAIHRNGR